MKKINITRSALCACMLALLAPLHARAQEIHPYTGAGIGVAMFDLGAGIGTKNAFAGFGRLGLDLGDYAGAEFRFGSTSQVSFTYLGLNGQAGLDYFVSYLGKLQLPVSENVRIYGLAGGTTAKASVSIAIPGTILSLSTSGTNSSFSFGGGLDFELQNRWWGGVEVMRYASDTLGISANIRGLF